MTLSLAQTIRIILLEWRLMCNFIVKAQIEFEIPTNVLFKLSKTIWCGPFDTIEISKSRPYIMEIFMGVFYVTWWPFMDW